MILLASEEVGFSSLLGLHDRSLEHLRVQGPAATHSMELQVLTCLLRLNLVGPLARVEKAFAEGVPESVALEDPATVVTPACDGVVFLRRRIHHVVARTFHKPSAAIPARRDDLRGSKHAVASRTA